MVVACGRGGAGSSSKASSGSSSPRMCRRSGPLPARQGLRTSCSESACWACTPPPAGACQPAETRRTSASRRWRPDRASRAEAGPGDGRPGGRTSGSAAGHEASRADAAALTVVRMRGSKGQHSRKSCGPHLPCRVQTWRVCSQEGWFGPPRADLSEGPPRLNTARTSRSRSSRPRSSYQLVGPARSSAVTNTSGALYSTEFSLHA
jgi:hypothetical protein